MAVKAFVILFDLDGTLTDPKEGIINSIHYAKQAIEHFNIAQFIDFIAGANTDGSRTDKKEIVAYAKEITGNKPNGDYLIIGDREFDIIGAHLNSIEACWVGYGYGEEAVVAKERPEYTCQTISELSLLLL